MRSPKVTVRITPKQGAYLSFIQQYLQLHGRSPSEAELQQFFMVSPPSVHQMIVMLERRGFISRQAGVARSIRVLVASDQLPPLDEVQAAMGIGAEAPGRRVASPIDVAMAFVSKINAQHVAGLCELMTDGHVLIDALDGRTEGRETMRTGWRDFFRLFPNYCIRVSQVTSTANIVGLFGAAGGSYHNAPKTRWQVSAAWKATVEDGLIDEWRVYCDTTWARRGT
jgi:repressor LexA